MTRQEFENSTFEEVMEKLESERDDITTYEILKEFAIDKINSDDFLIATHILEALHNDTADWYEYDYYMGTMDTPCSITEKEHVEHLIDDLQEVYLMAH